mgnify:CR=1 FL=1
MSNRDLLVDFLNYTREQNNIYDLIVKSITDSHQQTYHMLNTYLTDNNNESRVLSTRSYSHNKGINATRQ